MRLLARPRSNPLPIDERLQQRLGLKRFAYRFACLLLDVVTLGFVGIDVVVRFLAERGDALLDGFRHGRIALGELGYDALREADQVVEVDALAVAIRARPDA